jgi:hypothetical protein
MPPRKGNSPLLQGMLNRWHSRICVVYRALFILSFKWEYGGKRITGGSLLYLADGCAACRQRDMRYLSQLFIGKVSPL